jgi:subtilisin family serine protease
MPQQVDWKQGLQPKIADQVDHILATFSKRKEGPEIGIVTSDGGVGFMYAEDQLLVRKDHIESVKDILRANFDLGPVEHAVLDVALLHLEPKPGRARPWPAGVFIPNRRKQRPLTMIHALEQIDEQLGEGIATPDHLLTVAGEVGPCPATEPQQVYDGIEPFPGVCPDNSGAGVLIYVADTGLLPNAGDDPALPWLRGVRGEPDPNSPAAGAAMPPILPYAGHGTFVAGVARCVAPHADMFVSNVFQVAGSTLESDFVKKLKGALKLGVDIFHLSVTAPTRNDLYMLGFGEWLKLLGQYKGVVCVASAGNNGLRLPSWPAAFPQVVSVGALAADWRSRATFSNYGGWVDVYAPGRDLINAYATGTYTCQVDPYKGDTRKFYGMAKWSGTSFSTPVVTGLIAARMSRTGENGEEAAAALLAQAHAQAIPGVGAVLLPCGRRCCEPARPACGCCGAGAPAARPCPQ